MAHREIDVRGLDFMVTHPANLSDEEIAQAGHMGARALVDATGRSYEEARMATMGDDIRRHIRSWHDPNTEVGRRFNDNQLYADPLVAIARHGHSIVGIAYSANNTSGDETARQQKMDATLPLKVYDWRRWLAVHPNYQGRGTAKVLSELLSEHRELVQPISAYAWELSRVAGLLAAGGLKKRGEAEEDFPFGDQAAPIQLQHYVGRVAIARLRFAMQPGARGSIHSARRSVAANVHTRSVH